MCRYCTVVVSKYVGAYKDEWAQQDAEPWGDASLRVAYWKGSIPTVLSFGDGEDRPGKASHIHQLGQLGGKNWEFVRQWATETIGTSRCLGNHHQLWPDSIPMFMVKWVEWQPGLTTLLCHNYHNSQRKLDEHHEATACDSFVIVHVTYVTYMYMSRVETARQVRFLFACLWWSCCGHLPGAIWCHMPRSGMRDDSRQISLEVV